METVLMELTVVFDEPFWVGVFERYSAEGMEAARVVFGAEPKDEAVYQTVLARYAQLAFSPAIAADKPDALARNPKRAQREVAKRLARAGVGTKAQQALQAQREEHRLASRSRNRQALYAEMERKFSLRQEKRKQKHKGR